MIETHPQAQQHQRSLPVEASLAQHLQQKELDRLVILLRNATGGAWAIALYNTVAIRDQVMDALRARLPPLPVYDFTFTESHANPLAYLKQLPSEVKEKRAIIFLYDLTRSGERVWGYLEGVRASYERALDTFERFLPAGHPNIEIVRGNLESLG